MATKKKKSSKKQMQRKELIAIAVVLILILVVLFLLVHFNVIDLDSILGLDEEPAIVTGADKDATPEKEGAGDTNKPVVVSPTAAELADINLDSSIKVHFIDVGQGDSILIEMGTDTIMLIDAGHTGVSIDEEGKSHDKVYGSSNVPKAVTEPYFAYLDEVISHHGGDIDYLIATHSDSDHINMLPAVFKEYQVNNVYINDCYPDFKTSATVKATEEAAEAENNCNVTFFDTADDTVIPVETTEYKFTVYSSGNDGFKKNDSNGMSIMCLLEYGGRKVLFTGDATVATENWFIDKTNDKDFDIDVLKVGHHGSSTSSGAAFLDYVKAEYAVISSGKNNAYGHPTEEVMARLNERHMTTYNTQDDGTIVLYIDGDGDFCFVTEKSAEATE